MTNWILTWEDPLYHDTLSGTFDWDGALEFLSYMKSEGSMRFELEEVND